MLHLELIDTQWDVNFTVKGLSNSAYLELIDTQWDVNVINDNQYQVTSEN